MPDIPTIDPHALVRYRTTAEPAPPMPWHEPRRRVRPRRILRIAAPAIVAVLLTLPMTRSEAAQGETVRASVPSNGAQANSFSTDSAVSGDGRHVVFTSAATNLVPGDTNGVTDVFARDRATGTTTRVSVASNGDQADAVSQDPAISSSGRYVAFESDASNLVPGDTNGTRDVFVHDRTTGATTRVSIAGDGTQANGASSEVAVSSNGRYVAFRSFASNLVPGDTNGVADVFVHDRTTGATTRTSMAGNSAQTDRSSANPAVSPDGRFVAFHSSATNLVPGDTNGVADVFVHDRTTGATNRVSVSSKGTQADGSSSMAALSADGRFVAFLSTATNLAAGDTNGVNDVFVHDRTTGATNRVSVSSNGTQANAQSAKPGISNDGRHVAFESLATNLVTGDSNGIDDVFVHDRRSGVTSRVSVSSSNEQGNSGSDQPAISGDGRFVSFTSTATNLVKGDTNGADDVFVRQALPTPPPPPNTTRPPTTTVPPTPPPLPPPSTGSFIDAAGHVFEKDIRALAASGITKGCNPPANTRYCPDDKVTRGQMAAFLNRALKLAPATTDTFTDDNGNVFEKDIQALAASGITKGCNPPANTRYCPDDHVTRGQMAAFLNRALLQPR